MMCSIGLIVETPTPNARPRSWRSCRASLERRRKTSPIGHVRPLRFGAAFVIRPSNEPEGWGVEIKTIQVGDVVPFGHVPPATLARVKSGEGWMYVARMPVVRLQNGGTVAAHGAWVGWQNCPGCDDMWRDMAHEWEWKDTHHGSVQIVALDLTGQERARELQRLAEVFEVRRQQNCKGDPCSTC